MKKAVVSFQKEGKTLQVTSKTRRDFTPGIVEQQEMLRCDLIDVDVMVHQKMDKRQSWKAWNE